jgi:DNA-binding winged helix-turn-helix (wHTH) protein
MSKPGENRENSKKDHATMRFGPFTLDAQRRLLVRGSTAVHLTPKAFDLLRLLASEAPRVVSKRELHERLWPDSFVSEASLVELVKVLRRALDDHNPDAPVIRTAHRIGYALCLDVEFTVPHPAPTRHWLMVRGRRLPLSEGENVIGRDPDAQVWLDDAGVSRRHARIVIHHVDVQLEDLGSKNGTTIHKESVAGPVALRDGDRIAFGELAAIYRGSSVRMSTETHGSESLSPAHDEWDKGSTS